MNRDGNSHETMRKFLAGKRIRNTPMNTIMSLKILIENGND